MANLHHDASPGVEPPGAESVYAEGHTHADSGSSLPQLDPEYFASQIFWLVVTFAVLYYVLKTIALPKISAVLEHREDRIASDLRKAKELQKEAEYINARYNQQLAKTKAEHRKLLDAARAEAIKHNAEQQAELSAKAKSAIDIAEADIARMQGSIAETIGTMAEELAISSYTVLTGLSANGSRAKALVEEYNKGARHV